MQRCLGQDEVTKDEKTLGNRHYTGVIEKKPKRSHDYEEWQT